MGARSSMGRRRSTRVVQSVVEQSVAKAERGCFRIFELCNRTRTRTRPRTRIRIRMRRRQVLQEAGLAEAGLAEAQRTSCPISRRDRADRWAGLQQRQEVP